MCAQLEHSASPCMAVAVLDSLAHDRACDRPYITLQQAKCRAARLWIDTYHSINTTTPLLEWTDPYDGTFPPLV